MSGEPLSELPVPRNSQEMLSPEQVARGELFGKVCALYGVPPETTPHQVDFVITHLPHMQAVARRHGYAYGMPPHRMQPGFRDALVGIGSSLLAGAEDPQGLDTYFSAGLDVIKTATVALDSQDFREWNTYLDAKLQKQLPR